MSERAGQAFADRIAAALAKHAGVSAWQFTHGRQQGLQTYLVRTEPETVRRTDGETFNAVVFTRNGEKLGRSTLSLTPADAANLEQRIDACVFMAGLGGDEPWALPARAALPPLEAHDPALGSARFAETSRSLTNAWRAAIGRAKDATPSSMELFCAEAWTRIRNSAGLDIESRATRVSLLTIVLAQHGGRANESVSWEERRRAADLDVATIVADAAEEASDLTRAEVTPSGPVPVLIDAREMAALFSPIQANASAQGLYQKSSRFEIGAPLPISGSGGDPVHVYSNAIVPYGLSSYAFDGDGTAGRRTQLVKDGVFAQPWATKQFADYLGVEPTGAFANMEIATGSKTFAELTQDSGPVLHVRNFSWLTPDQARGAFGSEVRVGYLYRNGRRTPVKGGTVAGNLFEALGSARFSSERVALGSYLGPSAVRLEGLSVSGA